MFENQRKSLIQHCLHFEWTKVHLKMPKMVHLASYWQPEACGQTVLPGLIGQKLAEFKCDILSNFQTMWSGKKYTVFLSKSCLLEQRWYCEGFVRLLLLQWCIFWLPSCSCSGTICSVCQKKIVTRLGKKCYICRDCGLCCHKGCYDRTMNSCTKSTLESMEL